MTSPDYTLHYAPDNASLIIRLALEELRVPYRTQLVDRRTGAQKGPAHRRRHPGGLIPALDTPQGAIFETGAILLWLADRHGHLAPPPDNPARGETLKWLFYLSNTVHPALRMLFYPQNFVPIDAAPAWAANTQKMLLSQLDILEHHWQPRDRPNLLDLYLAPVLRWLRLYPTHDDHSWFDLAAYPRLHHMAHQLETRASTHAAQTAEGLGPTPFTAPRLPRPPEGSAL
ncbi:glutathione S-transferase family protein [Roseobacter sp.]|uniref:glutathione S-transferase family protein n=1 Tax=Roseobacter sp. TaxID=1907202 RepID=UPI0032973C49